MPIFVYGDIGLFSSILSNLISNAIKCTSNGTILISARKRKDEVLFQVRDSGVGIQESHIGKIFDEFYQIDNKQRDMSKGLGLGLSIAQREAELLGSEIICRSEFGRGSVFEFRLPLSSSPDEVMSPINEILQEEIKANQSFAIGKCFVIVEDNLIVLKGLANLLKVNGGEVSCFHNAEDALQSPCIENADYFIVDYMLSSSMNGIQFLNHVSQKLNTHVKAVILTGDTSTNFIKQSTSIDWPVLHKPINSSQLFSCLRSFGQ